MDADREFAWRAITAQDAPGWARLLLAIEEANGTEEIVGADDLVDDLRDPAVDPERDTTAALRQGGVHPWRALRVRAGTGARSEAELLGGVPPGQRGRGLGARLLAWAEQAGQAQSGG